MFDDISDLFGFSSSSNSNSNVNYRGSNISINIEIDFMEAINGATKKIKFNRKDNCGTCKGTKSKPGTSKKNCNSCNGRGKIIYKEGFLLFLFIIYLFLI